MSFNLIENGQRFCKKLNLKIDGVTAENVVVDFTGIDGLEIYYANLYRKDDPANQAAGVISGTEVILGNVEPACYELKVCFEVTDKAQISCPLNFVGNLTYDNCGGVPVVYPIYHECTDCSAIHDCVTLTSPDGSIDVQWNPDTQEWEIQDLIDVDTDQTWQGYLNDSDPENPLICFNIVDEISGAVTGEDVVCIPASNGDIEDNGDGTATITIDGEQAVVCLGPCPTLVQTITNGNEIAVYTGSDGVATPIYETITNIFATLDTSTPGEALFTINYTNEDDTQQPITVDLSALLDDTDTTYSFTETGGVITVTNLASNSPVGVFDICAIVNANCPASIVANPDGSFTVTGNDGVSEIIPKADVSTSTSTNNDQGGGVQEIGSHTSDGVTTTYNETITTLIDNSDGTLTYTSENGTTAIINTNDIDTTLVNNGDGTVTYTNESGATTILDICDIVNTNCPASIILNADGSYTVKGTDGTEETFKIPVISGREGNLLFEADDCEWYSRPVTEESCYCEHIVTEGTDFLSSGASDPDVQCDLSTVGLSFYNKTLTSFTDVIVTLINEWSNPQNIIADIRKGKCIGGEIIDTSAVFTLDSTTATDITFTFNGEYAVSDQWYTLTFRTPDGTTLSNSVNILGLVGSVNNFCTFKDGEEVYTETVSGTINGTTSTTETTVYIVKTYSADGSDDITIASEVGQPNDVRDVTGNIPSTWVLCDKETTNVTELYENGNSNSCKVNKLNHKDGTVSYVDANGLPYTGDISILRLKDNDNCCDCVEETTPLDGWSFVTCGSNSLENIFDTGGFYKIGDYLTAPTSNIWSAVPNVHSPSLLKQNVNDNEFFGVAMASDGRFWLAASNVYAYDISFNASFFTGAAHPLCNPATSGEIWSYQFDGTTINGGTPITTTSQNTYIANPVGSNVIPMATYTVGPGNNQFPMYGWGDITYNEDLDILYATNTTDARVYALDPNTGNVIAVHDVFNGNFGNNQSDFYTRPHLWGIEYNKVDKKLYFTYQIHNGNYNLDVSTTANNLSHTGGAFFNAPYFETPGGTVGKDNSVLSPLPVSKMVYRIDVDSAGFVGTSSVFYTERLGSREKWTGISFNKDNTKMLLSERGASHFAKIIEVDVSGVPSYTRDINVGSINLNFNTNPVVNTQFYNSLGASIYYVTKEQNSDGDIIQICDDESIWSTADRMSPDGFGGPGNIFTDSNYFYGVQGNVNTDRYYVDADLTGGINDKSIIGDIEMFPYCCCKSLTNNKLNK